MAARGAVALGTSTALQARTSPSGPGPESRRLAPGRARRSAMTKASCSAARRGHSRAVDRARVRLPSGRRAPSGTGPVGRRLDRLRGSGTTESDLAGCQIRTSCARGRRPRRPWRRRAPGPARAPPWPRPCAPPDGPRGAATASSVRSPAAFLARPVILSVRLLPCSWRYPSGVSANRCAQLLDRLEDRDRARLAQLLLGEAAGQHRERRDLGVARRLHVPGRVADHQRRSSPPPSRGRR